MQHWSQTIYSTQLNTNDNKVHKLYQPTIIQNTITHSRKRAEHVRLRYATVRTTGSTATELLRTSSVHVRSCLTLLSECLHSTGAAGLPSSDSLAPKHPLDTGTLLPDSFASFHRQNIQTSSVSTPHSPTPPATPLTAQFSPLPRNPKSTRSCPTVQTSNTTQIPYRPGFLKNVHPYLFPQSPILLTSPSLLASFIPLSRNPLCHHC